MVSSRDTKNYARVVFDYRCDGKVFLLKWNDSAVVNIYRNWENQDPVKKARRRTKGEVKEVQQPNLIRSYNQGMGGVDLLDRLSSTYRPEIRGKKWYWPLFVNILIIYVIAAWKLYERFTSAKMSHLEFRREIAFIIIEA